MTRRIFLLSLVLFVVAAVAVNAYEKGLTGEKDGSATTQSAKGGPIPRNLDDSRLEAGRFLPTGANEVNKGVPDSKGELHFEKAIPEAPAAPENK